MKLEPVTMPVEIKIGGSWVLIEDRLSFAEHERNAKTAGASEVRTVDGTIHMFLKQPFRPMPEPRTTNHVSEIQQ